MTSQFGTRLRQLRLQAGMTQEQLAERSRQGVRTIGDLETGRRTNPQVGTVNRLAGALDATPQQRRELLALAGDHPPPEDLEESHGEPSTPRDALTDTAAELAREVKGRWQREEEHRRILDPDPLPVRWQSAPAHLTGRWEDICRVQPGATSGPLDLTGDVSEIAGIYQRIPSGRLVVLGEAGSGKTVLALRFVRDYRTRTGTDPVPVIFSLGSWDPNTTALRDWLIGQLLRDYPQLAEHTSVGSTLAAALVDANRILPVLDGFDEIADGLYGPALEQLNATSLPWLLTSRPKEYQAAVAATRALTRAAGIQLLDLTPADLANYLPRTTHRPVWDSVLDALRDHPDSPLAAVLRTPLMVLLARTVYSDTPGQDPADLLDFPTQQAIEDHLLDSFVPTLYRRQPPPQPATARPRQRRTWDPHRVQHWLGYLAQHLDRHKTPDIAWWQLGNSLGASRILTVVLASALATAVSDWLVVLPVDMTILGIGPGLKAGLLQGLLIGPVVGLAFGLVYALLVRYGRMVFKPSRVQIRLLHRSKRTRRERRFTTVFGAGLLGGLVVGLGYGPVRILLLWELHWLRPGIGIQLLIKVALTDALVFGIVIGLAAGLVLGLISVFEDPLDVSAAANPISLLTTNRTTVVRQVLICVPMLALTIAFGGRLVVSPLQQALGPLVWNLTDSLLIGAVGGLAGGLSSAFAFTAWGQWVLVSRIWLPLTGRLPWAATAFLDDAYQRGVLRQNGAVYQFRHARLKDHLKTSRLHGCPGSTDR